MPTTFDRVREVTSTSGTGTVTLSGAVPGMRTFASAFEEGQGLWYCIEDQTTGAWEVGQGAYTAGTVVRSSVLASSNSGSLVNFAVGVKHIFAVIPAEAVTTAVAITGGTISGVTQVNVVSGDKTALAVGEGSGGNSGLYFGATGATAGAIWSQQVTPSTTNFSLKTNGSTTQLNGSTSSLLSVGNTTIVNATSAGAAVTGTLGISDNTTVTKSSASTVGFTATNSSVATAAAAGFTASNGTNTSAYFGTQGTGYSTYGVLQANRTGIYSSHAAGIFIASDNASGSVNIGVGAAAPSVGVFSTGGVTIAGATRTDSLNVNTANQQGAVVEIRGADTAAVIVKSSGNSQGLQMFASNADSTAYIRNFYNAALGIGVNNTDQLTVSSTGLVVTGDLSCTGALSKGSGSFRITHPLPARSQSHQLVHSFIEGPKADLIYRGAVQLVGGRAEINIDEAATMTEGTFEELCREVQCFTSNESDWTPVRGCVSGNILTIEAMDNSCTARVSWMVIGERKDPHMYQTDWTDVTGRVIVEPPISTQLVYH